MTVWLVTFLVHSTLWCGVAWLFLRLFPGTRARVRETVWYTALAASLITPTVHSLASPDAAVWRLPVPAFIVGGEHGAEGDPGHRDLAASVSLPGHEEAHGEEAAVAPGWPASAGTVWVVLAVGLLAFYILRLQRLRRRLDDREPVTDPRAARALAMLGGKAALNPPPRLTESHNLGSPVALGVGTRREICVPVRALHELDDSELCALLGHEVAHHLRRDTIRLAILSVLQAVFFFQPLFRLAAREVRRASEELCDDWAASQFEDRFAMARCLAEVARWVVRRDRHSPVPCIGRRRSQLELRVRRLMNEHPSLQTPPRRWRHVGAAGLLVLAPLFAPAVAPGADRSHEGRATEVARPPEHEQQRDHELRERRERGAALTELQRKDQ
ncbi:MAG: M56 family metallopeptidase [Gemmatimonadetes bacterium]|nr:M56 family metallopeptidase [Gemmatimonadota bacterium]MYI06265.1 M56 family metallopeptidase [Gemmatimonadota bacterium]